MGVSDIRLTDVQMIDLPALGLRRQPLFLAAFYLVPARWRAALLCLGSLVFYVIGVWQRPWCLAPLLGLAALVYFLGLGMQPREKPGTAGAGPGGPVRLPVLLQICGTPGSGSDAALAISFYSFQLAAYLIDVYRGRVTAETKPLLFFTGVLLFPKLLSGPLMDPLSLQQQLSAPPRPGLEDFDSGLRDFVLGLSMKVLLANQIGGLWRQVGNIGYESVSTPLAWMGIAAYSLQLYLDFCGYSWMALGLGRMLGFRLPRNFEHPYAARSMRDFWRRWHISLSSWFRDYVYIPWAAAGRDGPDVSESVGGMGPDGLWHGSTLNFLLWGLFLFALIAWSGPDGDRVLDKQPGALPGVHGADDPLSWLLFAIPSVSRIGVYLGRLFPHRVPGIAVNAGDWLQYGKQYWWLLVLGIVFSTPGAGEAVEPHPRHLAGHGDPGGAVLGLRLLHVRGHQRSVYVLLVLKGRRYHEAYPQLPSPWRWLLSWWSPDRRRRVRPGDEGTAAKIRGRL